MLGARDGGSERAGAVWAQAGKCACSPRPCACARHALALPMHMPAPPVRPASQPASQLARRLDGQIGSSPPQHCRTKVHGSPAVVQRAAGYCSSSGCYCSGSHDFSIRAAQDGHEVCQWFQRAAASQAAHEQLGVGRWVACESVCSCG